MKGDRCYVACIAFFNTGIITCHFPPWRWCIFLGGAWFILPSPAFIIVSGRLEWSRLMSLCRQATRATACLIRTLFFSYHSQIISRATTATCNHWGLCQDAFSSPTPHATSLTPVSQPLFSPSCSFSSSYQQHKDSSERKKWQHHTEEPNNCLHCWNSCSTSWVWPHLADSQRTHKPFSNVSLSSLYEDHMYSAANITFYTLHFTSDTQAFQPQDVFKKIIFTCCIYTQMWF